MKIKEKIRTLFCYFIRLHYICKNRPMTSAHIEQSIYTM